MDIDNITSASAGDTQNTTQSTVETTNTTVDTTQPTVVSSDWREALAQEFKEHKSLKDYKSVDDLVKSHINLEKMIGKKQPSVIGAEGETVYEADAYKYEVAEGQPTIVPEIFDKVSAKAAELKITPAAFKELVSEFLGAEGELGKQNEMRQAEALKTAENTLKEKWGSEYETKLTNAHKAFELFSSPELKETVGNLSVEAKTALTDIMANVYSKIGETSFGKGGSQNSGLTSQQAQIKIDEIRNDPNSPYNKGEPAARAEMTRLYLAAQGQV